MSLRDVVNRSSELARAGDVGAALALLDVELAKGESVGLLTRHAAVLSEAAGDLERARRYYEEGVRCSPRDPMALYGLATILEKLGLREEARAQARAAYAECRDSVALVEMIERLYGTDRQT